MSCSPLDCGQPSLTGRLLGKIAALAVRLAKLESLARARRRTAGESLTLILLAILSAASLGCDDAAAPTTLGPSTPSLAVAAVSPPLSFRQVSAGTDHSCGVTTDDRAYCWGSNPYGQLGNGTNSGSASLSPVPVTGGLRFQDIRAGDRHTCGITTDERAYCWGVNSLGQLGDGTTSMRTAPVRVAGGRRFRQISAGSGHTCAVTTTDVAFCWGSAEFGRLGTGSPMDAIVTTPLRVAGGLRFRQVIAAWSHTCGATTDFKGYCWGLNVYGELGDGTRIIRLKPALVAGGLRFRQVVPASGLIFNFGPALPETAVSCGVTTDDRGYCWGRDALRPAEVPGGYRFRFVSPGDLHACAVTTDNVPLCWGQNQYGQLGTGGGNSLVTPVPVAGGLALLNLSASAVGEHNCAVTTSHRAYCWGYNGSGALGDGTRTGRPTPVAVVPPM